MKLLLDNIIFDLQKSGGISVYWFELLKHLINQDCYYFDSKNKRKNIFRGLLSIDEKLILHDNQSKFERYRNHSNLRGLKFDIFHSSYYRTYNQKNIKNVVTVHDFVYERYFKRPSKYIHIFQKYLSLKKADGIICISNSTKNDLLKLYPHMKTKPIRVIYNGFDDKTFYPSIDNVTKRQVLFVGARSKRKNFHKVIELMKLLPEINLVIVGSRLSSNDKKLIKSIKNKVIVKENIKSSELRTIYSESICLLYMSEYEGFGLPVIEAMASGCPVLAMNKSSIPEISSDAGILFDSFDLDLISTEVFKLLDDKLYRESIITKSLINSKRFSWSKSISEHLQFYNQLTFNNSNINL